MGIWHKYQRWIFERGQKQIKKELLTRKDQIVAQVHSILDANLRSVSTAQIGGFRPSDDPKASWFGKVLVAKEGETWPLWNNNPIPPLVQFNLTEVPFVPERLKPFKMITLFLDEESLYPRQPMGHGWLIRVYESLDGLIEIKQPEITTKIKPFPIKWELIEGEGPDWEEAWTITDLKEYNIVKESGTFHDRYHNSEKTKLGGYPALIQSELSFNHKHFVFQIGSEEKAGWFWGDTGIGYFGLNDKGEWEFDWQGY